MDDTLLKYWSEALTIMEKTFSEVVFDTCIRKLEPLYIENDVCVLKTDMDFFKTTIEQRHLYKISSILKAVSERDIDVKIVSPEDFMASGAVDRGRSISELMRMSNLQSKYVFETFVKGKSNELAYAAAVAVAEAPGKTRYNPLFIYGGVGLGKTHLMHSIGNYILEMDHSTKVLYASTEMFMNELITSIRERKNQEFRNKYREIDVLLIDDVQFLSEREGTQEEFFHTFNTLYNANKQIVISSDKPPKELSVLEDRLRSRFGCGLIVDITLPDFETRTAILEKKAELDHIDIPKEMTKLIANSIVSNIRNLEGALNKVSAYAKLAGVKITADLVEKAIKDIITENEKKQITAEYIQEVVANYYNITIDEIRSKKRTQRIAYPRQVAMYLSRKMLDLSLPQLGVIFGRDHSTISHGCDKIIYDIEADQGFHQTIIELENRISG